MAGTLLVLPSSQPNVTDASRVDSVTPKFQLLSLNPNVPAVGSFSPATWNGVSRPNRDNQPAGSDKPSRPVANRGTAADRNSRLPGPTELDAALRELQSLQGASGSDTSNVRLLKFPDYSKPAPSNSNFSQKQSSDDRDRDRLPFLQLPQSANSNQRPAVDGNFSDSGPRAFLLPPELVFGNIRRNPPTSQPNASQPAAPLPLFRVPDTLAKPPAATPPPPPAVFYAPPPPPKQAAQPPPPPPPPLAFLQPPVNFFDLSALRNATPRRDAASGSQHDAAIQSSPTHGQTHENDDSATIPITDANIDDLLDQINAGFVLKPGTIADLLLKPRRSRRSPARNAFVDYRDSFDDSELDWQPAPSARAQPVQLVNVIDIDENDEVEKRDVEKPVHRAPAPSKPAPTSPTASDAATPAASELLTSEVQTEPVPELEPDRKVNGVLERIRRALSEIDSRRDSEVPADTPSVHPYLLRPDNFEDVISGNAPITIDSQPKRTTLRFADQVDNNEAALQKPASGPPPVQRSILKNTFRGDQSIGGVANERPDVATEPLAASEAENENLPLALVLREQTDAERRRQEVDEEASEVDARRVTSGFEAKRGIARALADMNSSLNTIAALERSASRQLAEVEADTRRFVPYPDKNSNTEIAARITRPSALFRDSGRPTQPAPVPRMFASTERIIPESELLGTRDSAPPANDTMVTTGLPSNDATMMSETQLASAEQEMTQLERDRLERKDKLRRRIERILRGEQVSPRVSGLAATKAKAQREQAADQPDAPVQKVRERPPDIFEVHRREREQQRQEAIAKREATAMRLINDLLEDSVSVPTLKHTRESTSVRRSTEWIANDVRSAMAKEKARGEDAARAKRRVREGPMKTLVTEEDDAGDFDAVDATRSDVPPEEVNALRQDFEQKVVSARQDRLQRVNARTQKKSRPSQPNELEKIKNEQKARLQKEESALRRSTVMYRTQPVRSLVRASPYDRPAAQQSGARYQRQQASANGDFVDYTQDVETASEISEWSVDPRVTRLLYDGASATDAETRSEFSVDNLEALASGLVGLKASQRAAAPAAATANRNAQGQAGRNVQSSQARNAQVGVSKGPSRNYQRGTNSVGRSTQSSIPENSVLRTPAPQMQKQARGYQPPMTDRSVASTLDSEMLEQYLHGDAETEHLLGVGRGAPSSRSVTSISIGDVDELADVISIETPGSIIDWNEVEQMVANR